MRMQVDRVGTLTGTELVGVGERVLQQLHDRDDAGALVLDVLDRGAVLANVGEQQRDSAAALDSCSAELIERPMDSMLSSMRSGKQLTGSPRCFLPELRKIGVAGTEPAVHDLVDQLLGEQGVVERPGSAPPSRRGPRALQVALAVGVFSDQEV